MTFLDLPPELLSLIVDEFLEDKPELKTLSLISRPLLSLCRSHLFYTVRFNTLNPTFEYKCQALTKLFDEDDTLLSHIRVLEIGPPIFRLLEFQPSLWPLHWSKVLERGLPTIHDERIRKVLQGAQNVQHLTLRFEHQSWPTFSSAFQKTVSEAIQRPIISTLEVEDISDFPLDLLRPCSGLRDLSLICVSPGKTLARTGETLQSLDLLKGLTLYLSDNCVRSLMERSLDSTRSSILSLGHLQRLSLSGTCNSAWTMLHSESSYSNGIKTLELRVDRQAGDHGGYGRCNLDDFPHLKSLLISTSYARQIRSLYHIKAFFERSTRRSALEDLTIVLRRESPDFEGEAGESNVGFGSHNLIHITQDRDWQRIGHQLTSGRFPSLRKMNIVFRPKDVSTLMNDNLKSVLHQHLMQTIPVLYPITNPTIDVYNDRFERYATQLNHN